MIWGFVSCLSWLMLSQRDRCPVVGRETAGGILSKYLLMPCTKGKFKEREHLIRY